MVDRAKRIGNILGEIERTKAIVHSPDRRSAYLTPLYTQLFREIFDEVKKKIKEEIFNEIRGQFPNTSK